MNDVRKKCWIGLGGPGHFKGVHVSSVVDLGKQIWMEQRTCGI
jgi:hypothetical protein